ncbi:MAG: hypothetical protein A3G41_02650 [Elusimicrobia bacterium RIFCSPLOWO2_12_FULL_59_9]|nr:MAG: hypothetical protein A3G41_02650 [Elusimicrobia bacterium RIFCSPLOWO2_12_FULL_59_9]
MRTGTGAGWSAALCLGLGLALLPAAGFAQTQASETAPAARKARSSRRAPAKAPAQPDSAPKWKKWLQNLAHGLEVSPVRKYRSSGTDRAIVAAVRGAPQQSADPYALYWKGQRAQLKEAKMRQQELELKDAVQKALDGDLKGAVADIENFKTKYPKSPLVKDAQEALDQLKPLVEAQEKEPAPADGE